MSCTCYFSSSSPCCNLVCKKTTTYCCWEPNRRSTTAVNSSLRDELELLKLKETNNELKYLINKLDTLSESIDLKRKSVQPTVHSSCVCVRTDKCCTDLDNKCNICAANREWNRRNRFQYDVVVCDDCERMVKMAKELDSSRTTIEIINTDSNIYPLTCEDCNVDHHRHRMDRLRRSRRSRSRSREFRRLSGDYSRSTSCSRAITPEPRPIWNGGPYTSTYLWRDWRLKECKKD